MRRQRIAAAGLCAAVFFGALASGPSVAAEVDSVLKAGADKTATAKASQQRIDQTADKTYDLLQDFRTVNKQIEGLQVYNSQLEKQVQNQLQIMQDIEESIENATVIERQIMPLSIKMLDALSQFVELDMPFLRAERLAAIEQVRSNLDSARFSSAEKFRQILELYDIESQYSQTIEQYSGIHDVDGQERQVTFLRVGRIALLYQTSDQSKTGAWNKRSSAWEALSAGDYRSATANGIRIAKKQAAVDIIKLPIVAPEAAQ